MAAEDDLKIRMCKRCNRERPHRPRARMCETCRAAAAAAKDQWRREYRRTHREQQAEYHRAWRERHGSDPEVLERLAAWRREYNKRPDVRAKNQIRAKANYYERKADPERYAEYLVKMRARTRKFYEQHRADPEWWANHLADRRMYRRLRAEAKGQPMAPVPPERYANGNGKVRYARGSARVPLAPLTPLVREWLGPDAGVIGNTDNAGLDVLADLADTSARRIYAILHAEQATVTRDVADRICTAIGVPAGAIYGEQW